MNEKSSMKRFKNAKSFFRIFPAYEMRWDYLKVLEDRKTVFIRYLQNDVAGKNPTFWKFDTDGIFYNNSQKEIYDTAMVGVIEKFLEGNNVVILNFGQTGCGKTLTASGLNHCYKDRGIGLRLIADLFRMKECLRKKLKMCVQMSYVETKNAYFADLLAHNYNAKVHNVKDVTTITVENEYAAMKLLFTAEARREFANDSVTSHAANGVLTFMVTTKPLYYSNPTKTIAKIHVVDLAGADSYGKDTSSYKNLLELNKANLTKTNLELFMLFLIKNNPEGISVKRRANVLLQYLSDSFNGHSILRLIGHIRVERNNLVVSLSMLRFGQLVRDIRTDILRPNILQDDNGKLLCLENELKEMQKERDLSYMIGCNAYNISQDRVRQMQHIALEYLSDKTDEIVICSVTDVKTMLKVFKNIYKLENEKMECAKLAYEKAMSSNLLRSDSSTLPKMIKRNSKIMKAKENASISLKRSSQGSISPKTLPSKYENLGSKAKLMLQGKESSTTKSATRRSKMNINIRKKTSSKRKSASGSDVSPINDALEDNHLTLPAILPMYSEAWTDFINDASYNYNQLEQVRVAREINAKTIQKIYLDEVKVLQTCLELIDVRKSELQKEEMVRLFGRPGYDENGNAIISDCEKRCVENLKFARGELLNHQEKVLKCQSDLIIALQCHLNAKKNINERFEEFCQRHYQILVPNLDKDSVLEEIDEDVDVSCMAEDEVSSLALETCRASDRYNRLQAFMKQEIRKIKLFRKRQLKWNL